jgi:hypothetical protein
MSKIIFLDIDGVLNRHHNVYYTRETSPQGFIGIGQKHLNQLKRIVDETGAEIVLTSDWKDCFNEDDCTPDHAACPDGVYLANRLKDAGCPIIARTDDRSVGNDSSTGRGYGIRKYLKAHPEISEYVILDDIWFKDYTDELVDHFVHLEFPLTKRSADKAIKCLKG